MKVVWSMSAADAFESAVRYIAADHPGTAARWAAGLLVRDPPARPRCVPCSAASEYSLSAMTKQDLEKWALELPAEDRVELGEALLSSVLPPLTQAMKAGIARRSRELQENPQLALSEEEFWSEVDRLATA